MTPLNKARNPLEILADFISFITNPVLVVIAALATITSHYADSDIQFWRWLITGSLLLLAPALLYSIWVWIRERSIDIDLTHREDRVVPLLLATLGALIGGYLVSVRLDNPSLLLLANVLVAVLILLTIITFVWKISLHAACLMALVSLVVIFRGSGFIPLYLLIIPVGWARLILRQHSPAQLIAGSLVGTVTTYLAAWLFRS